MARGPILDIKVPLPKRGFTSAAVGSFLVVKDQKIPLPMRAAGIAPFPSGLKHLPIKPLPGTGGGGGGGGGTVGVGY